MADPTRAPLIALWLAPSDQRAVVYLAVLEVVPDLPGAVRIAVLGLAAAITVRLISHDRPQGPWPLWRCPGCGRPCTALYLFGRWAGDAPSLGAACSKCGHLHYVSRSPAAIRTKVLRSLLGIGPGGRIPRAPLVPDRLVHGARAIKALRLRNLQIREVEAGTELALEVTL